MTDAPHTHGDDRAPQRGWQQHIQTFFGAAALALLLWNYNVVQKLDVRVAVQTEQIGHLTESLKLLADNQYLPADAVRDLAARDREIDKLRLEVDRLRKEVDMQRNKG